jgi:hypothetical protein
VREVNEKITAHVGDLRDGKVSCSCGWKEQAAVTPRVAAKLYSGHLNIPWDGSERWHQTIAESHEFLMLQHNTEFGPLGTLKNPPSKARIKQELGRVQKDPKRWSAS